MPLSFPNGNYRLSRLEYRAAVEAVATCGRRESRQHDIAIEIVPEALQARPRFGP